MAARFESWHGGGDVVLAAFAMRQSERKAMNREHETSNACAHKPGEPGASYTRREFLLRSGATAATLMAAPLLTHAAVPPRKSPTASTPSPELVDVHLRINGRDHALRLDPRVTLLDALRERLALTGTKKGCDHGQCGACTILVDGRRINSCLALAVMHDGADITTIEGLARGSEALDPLRVTSGVAGLHPVQAAFIKHDGFQCGYCTCGQICSAVGLLNEFRAGALSAATPLATLRAPGARPELTEDEIRERMSGNLCRCGAYGGIVAAVKEAQGLA
jgi:xanthine dehydrogenase YagT iron-sulfur-binding subunit